MVTKIYQIKRELQREYAFSSLDYIKSVDGLKKENYNLVYHKDIEEPVYHSDNKLFQINQFLEKVYYIFNCERPADFYGHSLSVSDIVEFDGNFYYCDSEGWSQINF